MVDDGESSKRRGGRLRCPFICFLRHRMRENDNIRETATKTAMDGHVITCATVITVQIIHNRDEVDEPLSLFVYQIYDREKYTFIG